MEPQHQLSFDIRPKVSWRGTVLYIYRHRLDDLTYADGDFIIGMYRWDDKLSPLQMRRIRLICERLGLDGSNIPVVTDDFVGCPADDPAPGTALVHCRAMDGIARADPVVAPDRRPTLTEYLRHIWRWFWQ